ncbi:MAG: Rpn family recombination-promoting nuclease/putative transposase [Chloroflexota bacterium]
MTKQEPDKEKDEQQEPKAKPSKEVDRVQNPHDAFFRRLFSEKEYARQFVDGFVPKELLALMIVEKIAYQPGVTTSDSLENFFTDLIFLIPLHPKEHDEDTAPESAAVYLLFDHKSYADWSVAEQLLRYMNERWELDRRNKMQPRVVIPIVFYHGKDGWNVPQQFEKLFKNVDPLLHKFIPKFEYLLISTKSYSDSDIEERVPSEALQSGLLLLKYIFNDALAEKLDTIMELLANASLTRNEKWALLEAELRYLTGVKNRLSDEVIEQSVRKAFAEEVEMVETIFERKMELGRQEGFREAEEKYQRMLQQEREEREREREEREREREEREREREAFLQRGFAKQRKMILGALNHSFKLSDEDHTEITKHLKRIEDEDALDRLINAALDASREDLAFFMMRLIAENNAYVEE